MNDTDMKNDAMISQMINTELHTGSIGLTSFRLSNAEIITVKTPINIPTNESIINVNLNICILSPPFQVRYYTIQHPAGHNRTTF